MIVCRHSACLWLSACLPVLAAVQTSHGVIPYWTGTRATNPPSSCYYGNSGWQYEGQWSWYLGTPIAPQYFITAKHVGGSVGGTFTYTDPSTGVTGSYLTTNYFDQAGTDLRIWQVSASTPFTSYAPLYTASAETGQTMTVFGRGTQRGSPVLVSGQTHGWYWGTNDHVQSWGSNTVSQIVNDSTYGNLLYFTFDSAGDWYEGTLSTGDSGGAVFIKQSGIWKLAGINLGVDGPFSLTGQTSDPGFNAAIFDQSGLYVRHNGQWVQDSGPAGAYATRISSNLSWIYSVTGTIPAMVPEPASAMLILLACGTYLAGRRTRLAGR